MKIGVLTWWRNNYGSILQAYALQHKLSEFRDIQSEIICQFGKKSTSVDNFFDKIKTVGVMETFKRVFWKVAFSGLRSRSRKMQKFVDNNLNISASSYNEQTIELTNNEYDTFICGSDQIWNPDLVPTDSMYWLGFAKKTKKKIAYAPSFGANKVTEDQKKQIKENLSTFDAISCREASGTEIINKIINSDRCHTVLDPTLLVKRELWDEISNNKIYTEKYIFTYLLRGTKKQRKLIEKFGKDKGLKIVSVPFLDYEKIEPYDLKFGDYKLWDLDPAEFISAIRHAKYVFCDSFHCIVFSILYHVPFYVFPKIGNDGYIKESQLSRMTDLINLVGIKDRLLLENKLPDVDKDIQWNNVDEILTQERTKSEEYLKNALTI